MGAPSAVETTTGWIAELELGLQRRGPKTVLAHRRQRGPLAVQRPFYPEQDACHLYLLHPPGGVVGGDCLLINTQLETSATAVITTPGATKFYRSAGALARQEQKLRIAPDSSLEWLPQENIFFPGTRSELNTTIALTGNARFIGWEIQCLGRPANQEQFLNGSAHFSLKIERDDEPFFQERFALNQQRDLSALSGLRNYPVTATLIATGISQAALESIQAQFAQLENAAIGHTLLDDILISRYLGHSTEQVRNCFIDIWKQIRPLSIGRAPCQPRIWST